MSNLNTELVKEMRNKERSSISFEEPGEIHLGIAFDLKYMQHFYALLASILENSTRSKVVLHAIVSKVGESDKEVIKAYARRYQAEVLFYQVDEAFVEKFVLTRHWSPAVYYRLLFPLIIPKHITRFLYLDTDMIVLKDLGELFTVDPGPHPVAAVYDNWAKKAPQLGIHEEGNYFNSGMLLMNIPVWRAQQVSEKCFDFLERYPEKIFYVDQDALNAVLANNWKKLDYRFNVLHSRIPEGLTQKELAHFLEDKVIIHYTLDRPWKMLCQNRLRHLYHYYQKKAPQKPAKKYEDFSLRKIPAFIKIRIVEAYHNMPVVKGVWRTVKSKLTSPRGRVLLS